MRVIVRLKSGTVSIDEMGLNVLSSESLVGCVAPVLDVHSNSSDSVLFLRAVRTMPCGDCWHCGL